ncbi:DUF6160 family protein [Acinetobacter sp. 3657]|uniref:DUF6160 family protein n=1 Tax=Acinetobacter sp. 3657 TaxID=2817764 RepID=UPI0028609B26|nr:hypothetical protein [Prolinoborus sp. 3657]
MQKNKKIGCVSLLLCSPFAMAMQPMDDESLALTTGQDGITVGVKLDQVEFKQTAFIDSDGLSYTGYNSPTHTNKAGLVLAGNNTTGSTVGVQFLRSGSTSPTFNLVMDTDAGTPASGGAFANIAFSFGADVSGLRILPFSVYMAGANSLSTASGTTYTANSIFSTGTTAKAGVKELLRAGTIDVAFAANKPTMNIQLGASPQGHMIMFGGAIDSICGVGNGCNIMLVSDYLTSGDPSTAPVGASFNFQFKGHTHTVRNTSGVIISQTYTPFSLNGFYAGVESGGLVFGNDGISSQFDLGLNNILLGTAGAASGGTNPPVFNHLSNGSMGNVGIVGASVTNLKMNIKGM